jgi:hypothetical protein
VNVGQQLGQLFGKVVRGGRASIALERKRRQRIAPRRAAHGQVDSFSVETAQHTEGLGDFERAVMGQHHAAAADADSRGGRSDRGNQHLGAGAGEHGRSVMLGHPIAGVAKPLRDTREIDGVVEGVGARRPLRHRRLIQDAQSKRHDRFSLL